MSNSGLIGFVTGATKSPKGSYHYISFVKQLTLFLWEDVHAQTVSSVNHDVIVWNDIQLYNILQYYECFYLNVMDIIIASEREWYKLPCTYQNAWIYYTSFKMSELVWYIIWRHSHLDETAIAVMMITQWITIKYHCHNDLWCLKTPVWDLRSLIYNFYKEMEWRNAVLMICGVHLGFMQIRQNYRCCNNYSNKVTLY